jgi:creatinine amidohydrolase
MGVYSSQLTPDTEVRLERMRPAQIDAARERFPAVYVAFGSVEWHGRHGPVGLDGIKAHEQLVGLAMRSGGVVYPLVPFGCGGGHGGFPHTYMVSAEPLEQLTLDLLRGFERHGYRAVILLAGHYPNRENYLAPATAAYHDSGGTMDVLFLKENQSPGIDKGCHACMTESSMLLHLHPETMDMSALDGPPTDDIGGPDETRNWMGDDCRDHPCYGVLGIDPRGHSSVEVGERYNECLLAALERWLRGEVDMPPGAYRFVELPPPHKPRCG